MKIKINSGPIPKSRFQQNRLFFNQGLSVLRIKKTHHASIFKNLCKLSNDDTCFSFLKFLVSLNIYFKLSIFGNFNEPCHNYAYFNMLH